MFYGFEIWVFVFFYKKRHVFSISVFKPEWLFTELLVHGSFLFVLNSAVKIEKTCAHRDPNERLGGR